MQADSPAVGQRLDWCLLPKTKRHDRDTAVWSPQPACPCVDLPEISGRASGQGHCSCVGSDCSPHMTLIMHPRTKILSLERQQQGPAEE